MDVPGPMKMVSIIVRGGVVQGARSNVPSLGVDVWDFDNFKAEGTADAKEVELEAYTKEYKLKPVY